jgi:hypothetical protein
MLLDSINSLCPCEILKAISPTSTLLLPFRTPSPVFHSYIKVIMATQPLVWFITGASSGFGASLAIHALKGGHKVIGTARDPSKASKTYPQISSLGGKWIPLDVTSATAGETVKDAAKMFGRIDVLVNNAGYSLLGAVEDIRFVSFLPLHLCLLLLLNVTITGNWRLDSVKIEN